LSYLGFNYPWNNWSPNGWHHDAPDLRDLYHETAPGHAQWVELYDKTVLETDPEVRKQMVWELQEKVVENVVGIDLLIVDSLTAWSKNLAGYGDGINSIGNVNLRHIL
jgi:ABC-type transport system substrate-binding protein